MLQQADARRTVASNVEVPQLVSSVERRCRLSVSPYPPRGSVHARIGAVRTPSGRRGRPRGRTDPPDGSPGPPKHKESGHQRTRRPIAIRASALDGGCSATSRLQACAAGELCHQFACSGCHAGNTCRKCPGMVAMPCWAKRAQHLGAHKVGAPAAESWTAGQKSGARAGSSRPIDHRRDAQGGSVGENTRPLALYRESTVKAAT